MDSYIHRLHLSIDHALAVSYRRNSYGGNTLFVAHISLVKGVPFYGFNVGYKSFLKIYMLNPLHMTRLADLLRQGTIMKRTLQPFESHMQYLLQWMCDYNLYGCSYLDCKTVKFRSPVPDFLEMNSTVHRWHDRTIADSHISDGTQLPRQSHCSLEVDVCAQEILNRLEIKERPLHHDFVERRIPLVPDEKLVHSMAGLWRDETRRRKARMGQKDDNSSPFPPDVLVSVSADPRNSQPGGWIHEEEYKEMITRVMKEERDKSDGRRLTFDSFVSKAPFEPQVKTSISSVEDLFSDNLALISTSQRKSQAARNATDSANVEEAEVDENRALSFEEDDFVYASDEEIAREMEMSQRRQKDHIEELYHETRIPENERTAAHGSVERAVGETGLPPTKGVQEPTSSGELAALGIRDAGDYSHFNEDAFEIPSEYATDIREAMKEQSGTKRPSTSSGPPWKRRRLLDDERRQSKDYGGKGFLTLADSDQVHESSVSVSKTNGVATSHNIDDFRIEDDSTRQGRSFGRSRISTPTSSQESQKTAIRNGNRTLPFPVVKDPYNLESSRRASQTSISPNKSSQKSKSRSLEFDILSDEPAPLSDSIEGGTAHTIPEYPSAPSSQVLQLSSKVHHAFNLSRKTTFLCFRAGPPSTFDIARERQVSKMPTMLYQAAFYSNEKDVPERAREYAGKEFRIESTTVPYLPDFDPTGGSAGAFGDKQAIVLDRKTEAIVSQRRRRVCDLSTWEIGEKPPSTMEVKHWLVAQDDPLGDVEDKAHIGTGVVSAKQDLSQIDGATQNNRHGFKYSQKQASTSVQHETQYMSIMSLEVHVNTRGNLVPNPEQDPIECVFWCIQSDDEDLAVNGINEGTHVGVLALSESGGLAKKISKQYAVEVDEESTELDLINRMVDIVRHHDPDILTGYEVHGGSWGYMIERARHKYDYNLCDEFSRMLSQSHGRFGKENDRWGFNHTSTIRVTGRHMINIWRAMRGELNLLQYTMENVVFHLLHRRIPHFPYQDLTRWYKSDRPANLAKILEYYISRVQLDLEILERNELVPRTSEQARLLGVDFFSVFSRGSQFKVESLMFRIAKPENFLLPSPSRKQVGQQNALECLPLVMEPQSNFYTSPLLVLDFQSLYPSVMIAYNYCYSTFLGRVVTWRGQNKMGFTDYQREQRLLELLKDQINIAPNGIMYVKPEIRKSLLAKMLGEILETRVMVKSGMKVDRDDKTLQRLLNNRQLALKLIANVTYGYTSASFSGRMPCSEIADSIVQTGRETLEKAIALIHSVKRWGAEVVYGDTDSLFVYLKGRTKDEAFDIGAEIAKTITDMNPRPVKLKFEKVYFPCVLLAKKRYVGFKYESKAQTEPDFDAKGIETVRRDGTPAEQKIEEKALKLLFRTADLSQVKSYFQQQCTKIMKGKVSIQDFCFAKEVKLGTYSDKGLPPPGALISTRRMLEDPRAEPQYGERVPYVVISGAPGARLIDRCVAPDVLLHNEHNELDAEYYITKNLIPPLERIFNLVGANVRQWYDEMPKFQRIRRVEASLLASSKDLTISKKTLESYMKSSSCVVCRRTLEEATAICSDCMAQVHTSILVLRSRLNRAESKALNLERVCRSCTSLPRSENIKCDSKDCAVFYTRARHMASLRSTKQITEPVIRVLEEQGDGAGSIEW